MYYSRRTLRRLLDGLCPVIGFAAVDVLCSRLVLPGHDRLAAVWEVLVMYGLSSQGRLVHERPLGTGRRPDIRFEGESSFVADVTCVSDRGLDERNPVEELGQRLEKLKDRLGLRVGGMDMRVLGKQDAAARGNRTLLRIPDISRLDEFVRLDVEPVLRRQMADGRTVLTVALDDDRHGLIVVIDPARSPISTGGYPSYDRPTIKDRNPLFSALRGKARQLRGAPGLKGIIVGDGDCATLGSREVASWNEFGTGDIVADFMRQYRSIDFVLLLSVREEPKWPLETRPPLRAVVGSFIPRRRDNSAGCLEKIFSGMVAALPRPLMMPVNARHRAQEAHYGLGHHGGWGMAGRNLKVSSRQVLELLAGSTTVEQMNASNGWRSNGTPPNGPRIPNPFRRFLDEGRLPISIKVKRDVHEDDDWLEIEFGEPDPALTRFRQEE